MVLDNTGNGSVALSVKDDHVTVEWLEIRNGTGELIETNNQSAPNLLVLRFLLLHDTTKLGIRIRDTVTVADVYDNIVYRTAAAASPSSRGRWRVRSAS